MAETDTQGEEQAAEEAAAAKPKKRISKRKAVEEHARSYFDALAKRDVEAMAEHLSTDVVEDVVPVGVLRGPAEIKAFFADLFAAVPNLETTVHRVVSDDRVAAVEWRMAGDFTGGPFQGIDPTGRRVEVRGLDVLEVEDGKITSNTAYYDGASFARQVGMLPPLDSGTERAMKGAFNAVTKLRRTISERKEP
ncbi:MAG TPA: ester cyclase [Thermoleophilaceae bacterium]|jgi:steroid delta-isomerase-like uncharacterized protein